MAMILKVQEITWRRDDQYGDCPKCKTIKVVIVDDDYDYGSQCDDCGQMVHIADVRDDVMIEDWRKESEENVN